MAKGDERRQAFQDIVDYFEAEAGTDPSTKFERISRWAIFEATGKDPDAEPPPGKQGEPSAAALMAGAKPPKKKASTKKAA